MPVDQDSLDRLSTGAPTGSPTGLPIGSPIETSSAAIVESALPVASSGAAAGGCYHRLIKSIDSVWGNP